MTTWSESRSPAVLHGWYGAPVSTRSKSSVWALRHLFVVLILSWVYSDILKLHLFIRVSVSTRVLLVLGMWRSEDILQELVLSYHVGASDWTQVDRLGGKHLPLPAAIFQRVHAVKDHSIMGCTRDSTCSWHARLKDFKVYGNAIPHENVLFSSYN